jgi:hypothetical protein
LEKKKKKKQVPWNVLIRPGSRWWVALVCPHRAEVRAAAALLPPASEAEATARLVSEVARLQERIAEVMADPAFSSDSLTPTTPPGAASHPGTPGTAAGFAAAPLLALSPGAPVAPGAVIDEENQLRLKAWSLILAGMDKDVLAWHRQVDMIFLNFSKGGEMAISDLCNSFKIMG